MTDERDNIEPIADMSAGPASTSASTPSAIISRQLGYASITTTTRYLDHIAPRAVIEAMRNRVWSGA